MKIQQSVVSTLPLILFLALAGILCSCSSTPIGQPSDFNFEWRFQLGEFDESAADPGFDDSDWQPIRLPHDWAIEGPFDPEGDSSTARLPWRGVGWYRKAFTLEAEDAGKRVYFDFDGVMAFPVVYINGQQAGSWDYGYVSFRVDATPYVNYGAENTIAVKVDTRKHFSRWYPGAGIYRKVTLTLKKPVHIANWGTYITTPEAGSDKTAVNIRTTVENHRTEQVPVTLKTVIFDPTGNKVASAKSEKQISASAAEELQHSMNVKSPRLWDIDDPAVYTAHTQVLVDGDLVDEKKTTFGIRTFTFTADDGFHLNGRRVQLKGVNLHHDHGPLGAAFNTRAMERQLQIMQAMGVNAIRTSHNPPAPELLDLCDRMGLLVWDECFDKWDATADHVNGEPLEEFGDKQYRSFVMRDRNHPSIIVWSIGNEIADQSGNNDGKSPERVKLMSDLIRKYDPARPIGYSSNDTSETISGDMFEALDIIGFNYGNRFSLYWERFPYSKVMYGESSCAITTRGFYELPLPKGKTDYSDQYLLSSYDRNATPFGDIPDLEFYRIEKSGFAAGEIIWSGFDYLGEPTPFYGQARSSYFGIVDLCGIPKDRYYLYRSHWRPEDTTVHILPHWNWPDEQELSIPVYVYTNGDEAELFLNGKSLGRRARTENPKENPNLAKGQPAIASSAASGTDNSAAMAADGSFDTAWTARGTGSAWYRVDLGEAKEIRYINVLPGNLTTRPSRPGRGPASPMVYSVQTSLDGSSWNDTAPIEPDLTARRYVPSFSATGKARFVRVVFSGSDKQTPGIREIEVFRYDIDEAYYYVMGKYRLIWDDVDYTPGELRAVAYRQGEKIGETTVQTSGETAKLSLTPDRTELTADGYDLSYILVEARDGDGVLNPLAEDLVAFEIEGPAEIAGVGNGNQLSYEPFQSNRRHLFFGKAMLIVRTLPDDSGRIRITAGCEGCEPASVTLRSRQ